MAARARRISRAHGRLRRRAASSSERDDLYWLSRFRFNATVAPRSAAVVSGPGAGCARREEAGRHDRRAVPAARSICAWRSPISATPRRRVAARVGRQELAFGEQRLVGHVSWLNTARTFDGARATIRSASAFQVDVFAASVVRILDDEFDKSGNGNRFAGAYATTAALVPQERVEPYRLLAP